MTSRTVTKALIAREDLALGQGATSQTRQGVITSVNQIDLPWVLTTLAEITALDTTKYKHCIYSVSNELRIYLYDASSAETADDLNYIDPDIGSGQWVLQQILGTLDSVDVSFTYPGGVATSVYAVLSKYGITPYMFGYPGSGDATSYIQAALVACPEFIDLNLNNGSYAVSGMDIGAKDNLKIKNGKLTLSGVNAYGLHFNLATNNVSLDNIQIVGDGVLASAQKGIYTTTGTAHNNTTIKNSSFESCMQNVDLAAHNIVSVYSSVFKNAVGTSAGQGYGLVIGSGATNVRVFNNYFENNARHSLYFGQTVGGTINGNVFYRHRYGLGNGSSAALDISRSSGITAKGNTFIECEGPCVGVATDSNIICDLILIANNSFIDTIGTEMQIGIISPDANNNVKSVAILGNMFSPKSSEDNSNYNSILIYSGLGVSVKGNEFPQDNSYINARNVILLSSAGGDAYYSDIKITNNDGVISGTNTRFVRVGTELAVGSTEINIKNNEIEATTLIDYASSPTNENIVHDWDKELAVTLALGSQTMNVAGYNKFYVTGNGGGSTVTDFDNALDKKEIELRFADANTTITRANARLEGGVNFTSSNYNIMKLKQFSTIWFEQRRSVIS